MRNRRNYYRILHVQPDAPAEIIRSSYRALMLQLEMHPDRGGEHWNAALINEAYDTLSRGDRRGEYDQGRAGESANAGVDGRAPSAKTSDRAASGSAPPPAGEATSVDCCVFCQTACSLQATEDPRGKCSVCGSPLFAAGRLDLATCGKRAASRIEQHREVRISTEWPQARPSIGVMRDVSPHGMGLETEMALVRYQIVRLDGGLLQAAGRVAHCVRAPGNREGWVVGIEFFTLLIESGSFVSRYV